MRACADGCHPLSNNLFGSFADDPFLRLGEIRHRPRAVFLVAMLRDQPLRTVKAWKPLVVADGVVIITLMDFMLFAS